jgi:hypothetical protein
MTTSSSLGDSSMGRVCEGVWISAVMRTELMFLEVEEGSSSLLAQRVQENVSPT